MADLIKHVKLDGTGDYTDLVTGFDDMLVSGLAGTGTITDYYLYVDGGTYSGIFSGYIPYSGQMYVLGSGTVFNITGTSTVSGVSTISSDPGLSFTNFMFNGENASGYAFDNVSGFGLQFADTEFINTSSGISNEGTVLLNKVSSTGLGTSSFVIGSGQVIVDESTISDYHTAIYSKYTSIDNSTLFNNAYAVRGYDGHQTSIENSLIYSSGYLVYVGSGYLGVTNSTLSGELPIYSDGSQIYVNTSILVGDTYVIGGTYISGSLVQNSATYPAGWSADPDITGINNSTLDPLFNNPTVGDFRLTFGDAAGSPYIEYTDNPYLASGVSVVLDPTQFRARDTKGLRVLDDTLSFTYKQGSTIRFSDYNKEVLFAQRLGDTPLSYYQLASVEFSDYEVPTVASFSTKENEPDPFPWDWDWKTITGTNVGEDSYLVPRSTIDVERIVKEQMGDFPSDVLWNTMTTKNVKVYDQLNYRGISFDPEQSDVGLSIMWILDGRNQTLIKQNAFSGEELGQYPLLCAPLLKSYVRPSGLVYIAADGDEYRFVHQDDPNMEILAPNAVTLTDGTQAADVPWIPTHLNDQVDLRGVLAYKGHVYITASDYYNTITDRSTISSGIAQGTVYLYPNNDLFYNYTRRPEEDEGPVRGVLAYGNMHPTDITVYEDGTFLVSDAYKSEIFRYKPAYDYALIQNSFDNETRVILRESYQDVDIKE